MRAPRHDLSPGRMPNIPAALARIVAKRRRRGRGGGGAPCPVEPNRPLDLSGGAAAALTFDD